MFYREAGDFKTSYKSDQETFPLKLDKILFWLTMAVAVFIVPLFLSEYWEKAIFLPFFIYALAAIGLNILTGYCGQVSLGTGGFMAVGAYASYKLMTGFPAMDMFVVIMIAGLVTAGCWRFIWFAFAANKGVLFSSCYSCVTIFSCMAF